MSRRGAWDPLLLGLLIAVALLVIIVLFWSKQGASIGDFLKGLFGAAPTP